MSSAFFRDRFTWLAYFLLAFYSYFLNVLGPITPFLKSELNLTYTVSSLHFTAFAIGMLLVGLLGHLVIERIGRGRSLWVGALGLSISAVLLAIGRIPVITIGASFTMGLVGSLILAIVPAALSDRHGEHRAVAISESNVISSLVSTAAPLMVGWFAHFIGGWRLALFVAACIPVVLYLVIGNAAPPAAESSRQNDIVVRRPLPGLFWVYWLAIVLAVSIEFCMLSWSADYLENIMAIQKASAAQAVSLFLAGMIIGRMAASRLVLGFPTIKVVNSFILVAAVGFLLFWKSGAIIFGLAGLFITGLGVAGLYPLILSLAIGAANNDTVQASARATLASGIAILTLPLVLGRIADSIGIGRAYSVVIPLLIGLFLMIQMAARRVKSTLKPREA